MKNGEACGGWQSLRPHTVFLQ
uniref:SET and MYND domain containing 1 n=2 Tax=Mus TaxID=862507 RepID=G3UXZ0_MOUSE